MTPEQINLVQESFQKVAPIADDAARLFYERLFDLDPTLRGLFRGDIAQQGRKLMSAMGFVVRGLDDTAAILPAVRDLGRRHAGYGVVPRHYETVGAALVWTLEQGLGDDFNAETRDAWVAAYGLLSSTMIEASTRKAA